MKLNTEEWKEFRIGDWFDGENGDFDIKQEHINGKGTITITSGLENYGILGKTDVNAKIIDSNTITIDMFGNALYRPYEYKMVTHARVFALKPKFKMTNHIGLFLSSILFFLKDKFSYSHMCSYNKIKDKKIKLPSKNGEPDWNFMEKYIQEIEKKYIDKVDKYNQENIQKALDVVRITEDELDEELVIEPADRYEEFKIDTLFKKYHGSRLRVEDRKEGNIPFITAGEEGRGVKEYISNHRSLYNNPITIDMFGNTFYHNLKLDGDDNIYFLINDELSAGVKLYISTVLNKVLTQQHSYAKQFRQKKLDRLTAVLPAIDKDTPDFEYMEKAIYIYTKKVIKSWQMDNEKEIRALMSAVSKQE